MPISPLVILTTLFHLHISTGSAVVPPEGDSAARLAPGSVLAVVHIHHGAAAVDAFHQSALWQTAVASPAGELYRRSPDGKKAMGGLAFVRATTGLSIWETLAAVLGDDAVITIAPHEKGEGDGPQLVAVVKHDEVARAKQVEELLAKLHLATGAMLDDEPDPDKTEKSGDVIIWNVPDKLHHAYVDNTLVLSNSLPALKAALARRTVDEDRLDRSPLWKRLSETAPRDATIATAVDVATLRKLPGYRLDTKLPNPFAALLFAEWSRSIARSTTAMGWVFADAKSLSLEARLFGGAEKAGDAAKHAIDATGKLMDSVQLPRGVAHITLFRDFGDWWSSRETTMTEQAIGEFGKFAGGISTLLGNLDFSEEFLPNLRPEVQFLISGQSFTQRTKPHPTLPAFALVFGIKDAKKIGPRLDSSGTIAVSLLNFQAANEGHPQYLVNLEEYRGHKATYTQFPEDAPASAPASQATRRGVRYNFEPAFARVNDRVIIATTREFMHDLVDAMDAKDKSAPAETGTDEFTISARQAREILADNRDEFIANEMLKRDEPRAVVAKRVDALLEVTNWFESATLRARARDDEPRVSVRVVFAKIPKVAASRKSR